MSTVVKGSKIKFAVQVDGLGEKFLSDEDVNIKCEYYIQNSYSPDAVVTINKADMVADEEGNTNIYYAAVDTTPLSSGKLHCITTITYPDENLQTDITEKVNTGTGVNIIEV